MNAETLKLIKAELKDEMKQRGFKTTGQWYMRFANAQIYQTVNFFGSMSGGAFTVHIGLTPALCGNTDPKGGGGFRLGPLTYGYDYWWGNNQTSAMDFVAKIREIVLPIFDACTSYRGMFDFVKETLLVHQADRKEEIKSPPAAICDSTSDITWAKILISLNEPECCKELLYNRVKFYENCLKRDLKKVEDEKACETNPEKLHILDLATQELPKTWAKKIDPFKPYIAAIEGGDLSEILAKIKENETKSADALTKYVVTVK